MFVCLCVCVFVCLCVCVLVCLCVCVFVCMRESQGGGNPKCEFVEWIVEYDINTSLPTKQGQTK